MSSVPSEDGVNPDETDPFVLLLDTGRPPLEEVSFGTMVSNLTGWWNGYSSSVTDGVSNCWYIGIS